MNSFRLFKEKCQKVYGQQDYWIVPIFRSCLAFFIFFSLTRHFSMVGRLAHPLALLFFSLISFFLPFSTLPMLLGVILMSYFYQQSLLLLGVSGGVFLFLFLLQSSIRGKYAVLIALMPLCFLLKIHYFLPIFVGLTMGFTAFLPLALGCFLYFYLAFVQENGKLFSASVDLTEQLESLTKTLLPFFKDKEMLLLLVLFSAVVLTVYFIRNTSIQYSWHIAVTVGLVMEALLWILYPMLSLKMNFVISLLSYLFSAALAIFTLFFFHDLDYRGTKFLQMEDDEYYYYVKAVPKNKGEHFPSSR